MNTKKEKSLQQKIEECEHAQKTSAYITSLQECTYKGTCKDQLVWLDLKYCWKQFIEKIYKK